MAETAAHLVDQVIPRVAVRQWVLSFPIPRRFLLAAHPHLLSPVLRVVNRAISTFQIKPAGFNRNETQTGAVTRIQRFGSAANLNIPLHCIYLDGVYDTTGDVPVFHPVHSPSAEQVQTRLNTIIKRIMKLLTRTGHLVEEHERLFLAANPIDTDTAMTPLQSAACTYRIALGPRAGQKVLTLQTVPSIEALNTSQRCANEQGFSLHAHMRCAMNQRNQLERLCRYITRPAIVNERLTINQNGDVVLQLKSPYKDGTTHIVMSPLESMQRLAALVPRPRLNLIRFHRVLAPNARLRSAIIPKASQNQRVFNIDVQTCPHCGGPLKIIAAIQNPSAIIRILAHLGFPTRASPKARARFFDHFATT